MRPEEKELKEKIEKQVQQFQTGDFMTNAEKLFATLGYSSERRAKIDKDYLTQKGLNQEKALFQNWQEAGLICQVTGEDMSAQSSIFQNQFEDGRIRSYLFYAIELKESEYPRGALAQITRYVNKLFPMPVFILFKYGKHLTLAIIDRRQHKKEESKDVLEKVTLIRNIAIARPHRAHLEILFDLSYQELQAKYRFTNFEGLHQAWQKTLDINELNKNFYKKLYHWYLWASKIVKFPQIRPEADMIDDKVHQSESLIRLLTRLLFCWFMKEKGLIQDDLFILSYLQTILKNFKGIDSDETIYYKAIFQNLFFVTLNKPTKDRELIRKEFPNPHYGDQLVYRYPELFKSEVDILGLFAKIPFLNGGLFDCLDQRKDENNPVEIRLDGFSSKVAKQPTVPDKLFFGEYKGIDLSNEYDDKKKSNVTVQGLIDILDNYKFTIEENTPVEEEIALDPELLGKVFENLLASYNPETHTTARKATGSFYTPREIVNYMVDESLVAYLETQLKAHIPELEKMDSLREVIREVLSYTEKDHPFDEKEISVLIQAIDNVKILDPACGSGAFPMGMAQKILHLLRKIDPENKLWFEKVIAKFPVIMQNEMRKKLEKENWDYIRKLGLIQECIYGIDIQPIAIQIAKLRFFISLLVDQKEKPGMENRGLEPLPNLDFKLVCANTLISPPESEPIKVGLFSAAKDDFSMQFESLTEQYFSAYLPEEKKKLKDDIAGLINQKCREKIREIEKKTESDDEITRKILKEKHQQVIEQKKNEIALWNSYKNLFKHEAVGFFETKYFFPKVSEGFDIVIGNPPYVEAKKLKEISQILRKYYSTYSGTADLYVYFYENGIKQLNKNGTLIFITSNKFIKTSYGENLRNYFTGFRINEIVDFTDIHVFEALVASCIFSVSKSKVLDNKIKIVFANDTLSNFLSVASFVEQNKFYLSQNELSEKIWLLENQTKLSIKEKIEKDSVTLNDTGNVKIFRGVTTGYNPAFIISEEKRKELLKENFANNSIIKPILQGRNIKKWIYNKTSDFLIFTKKGINIEDFPSIKKYLSNFKKQLEPGVGRKPGNYYWYEIQDNTAYYPEFEEEKIIWGLTSDKWTFAYDNEKYFLPSNGYILTSSKIPIKYLLALMNSKLMEFYFGFIGIMTAGGAYTLKYETVAEFPIKVISLNAQKPFITLVDQILSAKCENPQADTSELEREIDRLVYELYGLTEEEIAVVEGKNV